MREDNSGTPLSALCSLRTERDAGTAIARLYGEFDLSCESQFRQELRGLVSGDTTALVLDIRGLTFMDSTGLRTLVSLHNAAARDGFDFAVVCGEGNVRRVLRETGLDGVLPLIDAFGDVPPSESPV